VIFIRVISLLVKNSSLWEMWMRESPDRRSVISSVNATFTQKKLVRIVLQDFTAVVAVLPMHIISRKILMAIMVSDANFSVREWSAQS